MSSLKERVVSALNFSTGEGIQYYPSGCNNNAIEAFINDYFDDGSGIDDSSDDDSDHGDAPG